ncbi:hypothetical protein GCM10010140_55380 [Streptosporangium pseudovulgare]|uniref:Uncharacterized protein n=1 Tax=Streptosporangium pseudovulgare TaxID=35765 RepID=A0ABQ2R7M0_9ACTN|nr:hypothetical protein GCM10010140_55380 [Streptosporangium pseudovulgare]
MRAAAPAVTAARRRNAAGNDMGFSTSGFGTFGEGAEPRDGTTPRTDQGVRRPAAVTPRTDAGVAVAARRGTVPARRDGFRGAGKARERGVRRRGVEGRAG